MNAPEFTDRQAIEWIVLTSAASRLTENTVPTDLSHWFTNWQPEYRKGRGHDFRGIWVDGENLVEIWMDVYGSGWMSVHEINLIHSDPEGCECEACLQGMEDAQ